MSVTLFTYILAFAYLAAGSGGGGDATRSSEKDVLLVFVFVASEKLLLLGVEKADNITAF